MVPLIKLFLVITFLASCAADPVQKISEHEYRIIGKLDKPEYDTIIDIVNHHPGEPIRFYVTSIGGTSNDLFEAMDAIHTHGQVHWYSLNYCDSACAVMGLSSGHGHGEFRLHSFYKRHNNHIEAAPDFNEKIIDKLCGYGHDRKQLNHMFHSVEEMWPFIIDETTIKE